MSDNFSGQIMRIGYSFGEVPSTMKDHVTTRRVIEDASSAYGSGVWRTQLWSHRNRKYKALSRVISTTRQYIKKISLEGDARGERIVKTEFYLDIKMNIDSLRKKYWEAVEAFMENYDEMVEEEKKRLGGLASYISYPDKAEIARRFKFDVWFNGIEEGDDILRKYGYKISQEEANKLAKDVTKRTEETVHKAVNEAHRIVFDQVKKLADKLGNLNLELRAPLIDGVKDLIDLIPYINLTNDPQLDAIRTEIQSKLTGFTAKELKEDKSKREQVAKDAENICHSMASFFTGGDE